VQYSPFDESKFLNTCVSVIWGFHCDVSSIFALWNVKQLQLVVGLSRTLVTNHQYTPSNSPEEGRSHLGFTNVVYGHPSIVAFKITWRWSLYDKITFIQPRCIYLTFQLILCITVIYFNILHSLNRASWHTYLRKTNKMHTLPYNLFHLIYPQHVSNIIYIKNQRDATWQYVY
jgi:hypothetical protein